MAGSKDKRIPSDVLVYGIVVNGKAKAYNTESVKIKGEVEDQFEGKTFVLQLEKELDVVRMFEKKSDGTLERINPVSSFWFSWSAAYPETDLYK